MLRETDLIHEDLEGYHLAAALDSRPGSYIFLGESNSQTTSCQRVIIKLLNTAHAGIQLEQQHLLKTLSSLQQLHHPHILPILSVGSYKDMPYLISEYIASGSLYTRLQGYAVDHPLPQEEALSILTQLGQALHYAHEHHFVHGNLKPQNVLLNIQDDVLLTDFYLSTLISAEKIDATHPLEISTYWAPEQLLGHVDERSDQYGLSCLAYELLTGCKAFMVPSVKSPGTFFKTKSLIPPRRFNPDLSPSIEEAILKAMSKEPAQRYPDIQAFLAAMGISPLANDADQQKGPTALELPVTPIPEIDDITLVRMAAVSAQETVVPLSSDDLPETITKSESPSSVLAAILSLPDQIPLQESARPFPSAFLYGAINTPPFPQAWQKLTHLPRRTLFLSLFGLALVAGSFFLGFNALISPKKLTPIPHSVTILATQFPFPLQPNPSGPTKTVVSTSSSTPAGIPISQGGTPYSTATPVLILLPTPTLSLTPGSTPPVVPTPVSTYGPAPEPTPSHHPTPNPPPQPPPTQPAPTQPAPTQPPPPPPPPTPTRVPVVAPLQVPLASFFNNEGIGDSPGSANFDGSGFSYPAQLLPSASLITMQGISYQFPGNSPGTNDNLIPFGQQISFNPGNYSMAYLLASSSWGPVSGTVTIQYADGSTSTTSLTVPDWCSGASNALSAPYRYNSRTRVQNIVYIYPIPIMLDSTRTVASLLMPRVQYGSHRSGRMHIFALTLQP